MRQSNSKDVSQHILPVSSTMIGVCMTVITVMQLAPKNSVSNWADELLALNSLFFLGSTILSYWSLRTDKDSAKAEIIADRLFIVGMILMVIISFLIAFELFENYKVK